MCLAVMVVVVAAMSVVGRGSMTAMVEEAAMVAAEEVGNGRGGQGQRVYNIYLEKPGRLPSPTRINLEEPGRLPSPTRINLEEPGRLSSPTRINLDEPGRLPSPTRINLEEPEGYPAQPGLICFSVCLSVCQ
jgi:hypothetical protein